jgi:hypothetical protein
LPASGRRRRARIDSSSSRSLKNVLFEPARELRVSGAAHNLILGRQEPNKVSGLREATTAVTVAAERIEQFNFYFSTNDKSVRAYCRWHMGPNMSRRGGGPGPVSVPRSSPKYNMTWR